MNGLELRAMDVGDIDEVIAVQRAAFGIEAQLYDDPGLPPLLEDGAGVRAHLTAGAGFVALWAGRVVGSVRVLREGRSLHISRLAVAPDFQGRGIGASLLARAEAAEPAEQALLFTGHLSVGNLRLYGRAGYIEERRVRIDDRVTLVHLRKPLGTSAG